jgi:hypothetical protein
MLKTPKIKKFEEVQEFCGRIYRNWIVTVDWHLKANGPFRNMFRRESEADCFIVGMRTGHTAQGE